MAPIVAGSCALLSICDPMQSVLRVACVGDSRAILRSYAEDQQAYAAQALSHDQTGLSADEVARTATAHPGEKDDILDRKSGRLTGIAVTRAFGDHRWKWPTEQVETVQKQFFGLAPRPNSKTPPYMTAEPVFK